MNPIHPHTSRSQVGRNEQNLARKLLELATWPYGHGDGLARYYLWGTDTLRTPYKKTSPVVYRVIYYESKNHVSWIISIGRLHYVQPQP